MKSASPLQFGMAQSSVLRDLVDIHAIDLKYMSLVLLQPQRQFQMLIEVVHRIN